jgi:predicted aspartyl protease
MKRAICFISFLFVIATRPVAADDRVTFELHRGYLIVVKCSIGTLTGLTGIIDTGTSESVVDLSVVKRLGLTTRADRATFLTREVKVLAVSIPSVQIGTRSAGPLAGIATDLYSLTSQFGIRPDVLIGMDFLRQTNFTIDYVSRMLEFSPSPTAPMKHSAALLGDDRLVLINVAFKGKPLVLQMDTGSDKLILYDPPVAMRDSPGSQMRLASLSRNLIATSVEDNKLCVGGQNVSGSAALIIRERPPADFDGVLGAKILHARRIGFDFTRRLATWD